MSDKFKLIGIKEDTKKELDFLKIIPRESYNDVIKRKLHNTNIEIIMNKALEKNKIEFVEQYPIRCKYGYIVDFFLPKYNLIVECDGEMWHPENNSHDRKRDAYLKKKGFKILRFKGQEIINNIQSCIENIQIEGGIKSNGES